MTLVVLINGPKGVGKDTAALAIAKGTSRLTYVMLPVMSAFKLDILELHGIAPEMFSFWESMKDVPADELGGKSFRQVVIEHATAQRAKDPWHFARRWQARFKERGDNGDVCLVPDVRFFEEFIIGCDTVGGANVYLLRVMRPGHDWTGDVGGYIRTDMAVFGNKEMTITNDMDQRYYELEASVFVNGWAIRKLGGAS